MSALIQLVSLLAFLCLGFGAQAQTAKIAMEEFMVPTADAVVRLSTGVKDVGSAVDFILKRRGVSKINLQGWSAGATVMGWYTTQNNDKVNKLVLRRVVFP